MSLRACALFFACICTLVTAYTAYNRLSEPAPAVPLTPAPRCTCAPCLCEPGACDCRDCPCQDCCQGR